MNLIQLVHALVLCFKMGYCGAACSSRDAVSKLWLACQPVLRNPRESKHVETIHACCFYNLGPAGCCTATVKVRSMITYSSHLCGSSYMLQEAES